MNNSNVSSPFNIHTNLIEIIKIKNENDIIMARTLAKEIAKNIGFKYMDLTRIATAITELARNSLQFAGTGDVIIKEITNRRGIEIIIEDKGPGIEHLELALKGGYSTYGGLGLGLSGAKKLMDDFNIDTGPGKGTKIVIRKYL